MFARPKRRVARGARTSAGHWGRATRLPRRGCEAKVGGGGANVSSELVRRVRIRRPKDVVFAMLSDHEGMARWPGVSRCRLVTEGQPRNGVGAVRQVTAGGLTLLEEVVEFSPPDRFAYTIIKGLPVEHLGTLQLFDDRGGDGDATLVEWRIRMTSRWPGLAPAVRVVLGIGLGRALSFVRDQLEAGAGGARAS